LAATLAGDAKIHHVAAGGVTGTWFASKNHQWTARANPCILLRKSSKLVDFT
jgi:hypothetical protein